MLRRKENYCFACTYILDFTGKGRAFQNLVNQYRYKKIDKDRTACFYILSHSMCLNEFAYNLSSNVDI